MCLMRLVKKTLCICGWAKCILALSVGKFLEKKNKYSSVKKILFVQWNVMQLLNREQLFLSEFGQEPLHIP